MEWHINDLSIDGQFADPQRFKEALEPLLQLRVREPILRDRLFCSRSFIACAATANVNIQQAVIASGDKSFKELVLAWLGKAGPFWDDERQFNDDDYFEYQGYDVTEQGLGEVSRRILVEINADSLSFQGSKLGFAESPLSVQHGLAEAPIGFVDVNNCWDLDQLKSSLDLLAPLNCWQDLQTEINRRFDQLVISNDVMDDLLASPFTRALKNRILKLLAILNQLVDETEKGGKLSKNGEEILGDYFAGTCGQRQPLFKPESPTKRNNFKAKLTFFDPGDSSKTIFCHWHGKIQTPQTRIHFEWPRPSGQREIKIVYIGPKITI